MCTPLILFLFLFFVVPVHFPILIYFLSTAFLYPRFYFLFTSLTLIGTLVFCLFLIDRDLVVVVIIMVNNCIGSAVVIGLNKVAAGLDCNPILD